MSFAMSTFHKSARHANFDPETGVYTSANLPTLRIPDHLTIDQLLFDYSREEAAVSTDAGVGHFRPRPDNQIWLIDSVTGQEFSFEACKRRVESLSEGFYRTLGLRNDQVVVIYSPNDIDYPIVVWSAFRAGAIVSGVNPASTLAELEYQLKTVDKHFTIAGLVVSPEGFPVAHQAALSVGLPVNKIVLISSLLGPQTPSGIPREVLTIQALLANNEGLSSGITPQSTLRPGESKTKIAFLSFSSGTTGPPKAVLIPHYSVIANTIQISAHENEDLTNERTLVILPYYHAYALVVVLHAGLYRNLANVVVPKFHLENFLDCLIRYRVSTICLVPPIIVLLAKHNTALERKDEIGSILKRVLSAAAPLTGKLISVFKDKYPNTQLMQAYGMTETGPLVTLTPRYIEAAPGASAGVICPNVSIKIVDDGKSLGFGQVGEIWMKSPANALGYLDNPQATHGTFGADGYVKSGDKGYIDEFGWLYVVDRLKDLLKVKGNQVAPAELEGHLLGHPAVQDACVIGIPDEYAGELPRAFVVRSLVGLDRNPIELVKELKKFVSDHKVKDKWLEGGIEFVDSIPKNPSGKLLRRKLKEQYYQREKKLQDSRL